MEEKELILEMLNDLGIEHYGILHNAPGWVVEICERLIGAGWTKTTNETRD